MGRFKILFSFLWLAIYACSGSQVAINNQDEVSNSSIIAFGSCNKQDLDQSYWSIITGFNPDLWIWGGDNIYADTGDSAILQSLYDQQMSNPYYAEFAKQVPITGTWDDHDYGQNDGGRDWAFKEVNKHYFSKFMGYDASHFVATHPGVYTSYDLQADNRVRILLLDTRTFRDTLKPSINTEQRYVVNTSGDILGEDQWKWLAEELSDTTVGLFIVVSSIQVLAEQQSFEKWANFPAARDRLLKLISHQQPKGIIFISGDRHISEVSRLDGLLSYPIFDITCSGLTHTWGKPREETNLLREGELIIERNFGLMRLILEKDTIQANISFHSTEDGKTLLTTSCSFRQ